MLTKLHIRNFKSLRDVELCLGRLNVFIGANASGKSNVLDALRVLQGIGNRYSLSEILNGKPKSATNAQWEGIRGGSANVSFDKKPDTPVRFGVTAKGAPAIDYSFAFLPDTCKMADEYFSPMHDKLFQLLANVQRINPSPAILGQYTQLQHTERMGEQGENFAGLVKTICDDPESKAAYLGWLQHLRPDRIEDMGVLEGAMSDLMFYIEERGQKFPAPVLSEGTLRFAALAAAFFQPDMPAAITIEEPENGIHPSRLRLLMELLREQSARTGTQVFITTHSPVLLDWLQPEDYAHTFFCKRENSGESQVRSLADIPLFNDVVKQAPLGELFSEGWLEDAL